MIDLDNLIRRLEEHTDREKPVVINDFGKALYITHIDYRTKDKTFDYKCVKAYRDCLIMYEVVNDKKL